MYEVTVYNPQIRSGGVKAQLQRLVVSHPSQAGNKRVKMLGWAFLPYGDRATRLNPPTDSRSLQPGA